jgi:hypothetical protein
VSQPGTTRDLIRFDTTSGALGVANIVSKRRTIAMSKAALLVSTGLALVMCAASANAQMQPKQPEGAAQTPSAPAPAEKGAEPSQDKAQPKAKSQQGELKSQPGKGKAQAEPKDTPKKGTAQTAPKDQGSKSRAQAEPADKATKGSAQTQPADKGTKGTASDTSKGTAPKSSDTAKAPAKGERTQISEEQRANVRQTILKERSVNRVSNVNVQINIGTRVPRSVRLAVLPASIIAVVPAYRSYRYFVIDDRICIVDPDTYEIVEVVTGNGQTARVEDRGGSAMLVLSDDERAFILREVDMSGGSTLALGALTEGADVPRDVELRVFPGTVVQQIPKLRDYKFLTVENRVAIIDPKGTKVQLVIEDQR